MTENCTEVKASARFDWPPWTVGAGWSSIFSPEKKSHEKKDRPTLQTERYQALPFCFRPQPFFLVSFLSVPSPCHAGCCGQVSGFLAVMATFCACLSAQECMPAVKGGGATSKVLATWKVLLPPLLPRWEESCSWYCSNSSRYPTVSIFFHALFFLCFSHQMSCSPRAWRGSELLRAAHQHTWVSPSVFAEVLSLIVSDLDVLTNTHAVRGTTVEPWPPKPPAASHVLYFHQAEGGSY